MGMKFRFYDETKIHLESSFEYMLKPWNLKFDKTQFYEAQYEK